MDLEAFLDYAHDYLGAFPEHLFGSHPTYSVLRHAHNGKWFAVVMDVPRSSLDRQLREYGFANAPGASPTNSSDSVWVAVLKNSPENVALFVGNPGFYPAYHMNKKHWLAVSLDGSLTEDEITDLLHTSYELTR